MCGIHVTNLTRFQVALGKIQKEYHSWNDTVTVRGDYNSLQAAASQAPDPSMDVMLPQGK